jgi:hypothetical protein
MSNATSSASNSGGWSEFLSLFPTSNASGLATTHVYKMYGKPTLMRTVGFDTLSAIVVHSCRHIGLAQPGPTSAGSLRASKAPGAARQEN